MRTSRARTCAACGGSGRPRRHLLGRPNTIPGVSRSREGAAGPFEVWAARAWNVFNEGRPFTLVYPVLVLLAAELVGLAPDGPLGLALLGAFPLRGRALLWLALAISVPLLEPWRAPGLVLGALAGWVFFTVFFWGTFYY